MDVEFELKLLIRSTAKLEGDVRENYGLIQRAVGQATMMQRFREIAQINRQQDLALGQLTEGLRQITEAMRKSKDSALSGAASQITLNVSGGSSHAVGTAEAGSQVNQSASGLDAQQS